MTTKPPPDVERHTFSKEERLRGRLRVQEVVTTGRTVHEAPFKLTGKIIAASRSRSGTDRLRGAEAEYAAGRTSQSDETIDA
ncbi:MAG: hypothetical protein IPI81_12935 [Flavobacteriales bacterium]|nr:hypothetical protein [Flavobacteriales bacterium]